MKQNALLPFAIGLLMTGTAQADKAKTQFDAELEAGLEYDSRLSVEQLDRSRDRSDQAHLLKGKLDGQWGATEDLTLKGGYSYVGMYGWTLNPCVEWYVIEDTFKTLPFNPGGTVDKGQVTIDGGTYQIYTRDTTGTGGSRCGNVSNWIQYYSIRTSPRSCGVISLTDHFEAWESKGMSMAGNLLEAKILAEVGGDAGSVDFPVANVTTTQ